MCWLFVVWDSNILLLVLDISVMIELLIIRVMFFFVVLDDNVNVGCWELKRCYKYVNFYNCGWEFIRGSLNYI